MADLGIKISKPGYDVFSAGDADLLFSSSWPSLPIAFEGTLEGVSSASQQVFNHNLQFPPFTVVWRIQSGVATRLSMVNSDFVIEDEQVVINDTDPIGTVDYHVKCYNINLATEIEYPFIKPPTDRLFFSQDYGIKINKEGRDLESTDMRDFILHSRCQSPLILAVKTEASAVITPDGGGLGGGTVSFEDPQGYSSWVFAFVKNSAGEYRWSPYESSAYPQLLITESGGIFTYSQYYNSESIGDTGATIVALRDPMFAPVTQEVSY